MVLDSVRLIIKTACERSEGTLSSSFFIQRKNELLKTIVTLKREGSDETARWLNENRDFVKKKIDGIEVKKMRLPVFVIESLRELIDLPEMSWNRDDWNGILECMVTYSELSELELNFVPDVWLLLIAEKLVNSLKDAGSDVVRMITLMHRFSLRDISSLLSSYSPVERVLKHDPDGTYLRMTRESQSGYLRAIRKEAKRRGVKTESLAKKLLEKAEKEKRHIGFFIPKRKNVRWFYPVLLFVFSVFLADFYFATKSVVLSVLISPAVYCFVLSILEYVASKLKKSEPLPAIKMDKIDEQNKTCIVITALLTSIKDLDSLCTKLLRYKINNHIADESVCFGLLCDLKESTKENESGDESLKQALSESIERLNAITPVFFAYVRNRTYHKSENCFVGKERKRGAIDQLVASFCGEDFINASFFGSEECVKGVKYLITLDSDTELLIGQARRLVGIMAHPLHKPEISSDADGKRVVRGHGIIQPKVSTTLLERITTPYAKIYNNGSGEILYAGAGYDTLQSFYGEANFCGKGIIDVHAFYQVLHNRFPEQTILSHDMPEGALLRAGLANNEYFSDSSPQNSISHYKRLHRWIRGDVQNLSIVSMLSPLRKYLLFENLIRYVKPLFELVFMLVSFLKGNTVGLAAVLLVFLFHSSVFCCQLTDFILSGRIRLLNRRFSTRMRNLILNSFYRAFISFCAIGFEAWYFSDALIRSTFRMTVTKKKMLQWQVYESSARKKSYFSFYFSSLVSSILLLFILYPSPVSFFFIPFGLLPLLLRMLDRPYSKSRGWSSSEKEKMTAYADRELRFFRECVNESTNYLPPDNIQLEPVEKVAMRTSPTNIGLYLASITVSTEIGLMSVGEMLRRVEKALTSLEKMERYHGHFFNWYDLETLGVIGERFISTVDSGNFFAGLIVTRQIIDRNLSEHGSCQNLITRIDRMIAQVDFRILYRREKNVFSVGLYPDDGRLSESDYDMYMSEARITGFMAIAMGQIPVSHWSALSRPILSLSGRVGAGSWSGTAFEYFMPPLFLPVIENSLEDETLDFALYCQMKYTAALNENDRIFGISESGYSLTDREQNYQYKAFGVPFLSVQGDREDNKVISPYSSFLMLEREKSAVLDNLKLMEKQGFTGVYGFFEAFEFNSNFLDDYTPVRSYMSHHKGMSFLSLANAISNRITARYFISYDYFSAKTELLAERFPIEADLTKIKMKPRVVERPIETKETKAYPLNDAKKNGFLLTDGKLTLEAFDDGSMKLICFGKTALSLESFPNCYLDGNDLTSGENVEKEIAFGETYVEYCFRGNRQLFRLRFDLLCGQCAVLIRAFIDGYSGSGDLVLKLFPRMCDEKSFLSHPSFHLLSMEVKNDSEGFVLRKRETDNHRYFHVKANDPLKVLFGFEEEKYFFPYRMLSRDWISLSLGFNSHGSVMLPLLISFSEKEKPSDYFSLLDGSFAPNIKMQKKAASTLERLYDLTFYDTECKVMESKFLSRISGKTKLFLSAEPSLDFDFIWKHGISGDYPIVTVFYDREDPISVRNCEIALRVMKKLAISQISFDMVILHKKGDGYFDLSHEELTAMISRFRCEFLLGKHPGIHFVSTRGKEECEQFGSLSVYTIGMDESNRFMKIPSMPMHIHTKHYSSSRSNRIGDFDHGDFVLNKKQFLPIEPFSHVVCDDRIGFICDQNSLGYTWYRNSGLFRLSKWENIPTQQSGEKLVLKIAERCYDLISFADEVRYRKGFVMYRGTVCGSSFEIISGVCRSLSSKYVLIRLSKDLTDCELTYSFIPVLGKEDGGTVLVDKRDGVFVLNRSPKGNFSDGGWFKVLGREASLTADRDRIAFSWEARSENLIFLGGYSTERHLDYVLREIDNGSLGSHLKAEKDYLDDLLPACRDAERDWISYQAIFCRFVAKSGLYQSGGAYGFRDQLQDSLAFLGHRDDLCRRHILRCAAHQFEGGDVLHWWHPQKGRERSNAGIRSRCSDDYLWLLYVVGAYLDKTSDLEILSIKIPFLAGDDLLEDEDERYVIPERGESDTLLQHLIRAAKLFISRGLGDHGLPFIGSCDWNDGMNRLDGESVWLGFFGAICLKRLLPFVEADIKKDICDFLDCLKDGLSRSFNGAWFVRAYTTDGRILGSDVSLESECSIDLITQAFAALYQLEFHNTKWILDDENVVSALLSAHENLFDKMNRVLALFKKPFRNTVPSPGYIQRYVAGVRENGGQYTHAAVWYALAALRYGKRYDRKDLLCIAREVKEALDPFQNILTENYKRYRREPYVLCGDVYTARDKVGQGGWSWYTGAAGWYLRLIDELDE